MSKTVEIPEVVKSVATRGRGRPSKALSITGTKSLQERATAINSHHTRAREHAAMAAYYMVLCGFELLAVQSTLQHGEWEPWVEDQCPFNTRTAWHYMETARRLPGSQISKALEICQEGKSLLSLPAPQREKAIAAIKRATDGKTITQLYFDLDIVKPQRTYEHIGGNAELRAWLSEHHPDCKVKQAADLPDDIRDEWEQYQSTQGAEQAHRLNMLNRNAWNKALSELMRQVQKRKFAILTRPELEHAAALLQDLRSKILEELKK